MTTQIITELRNIYKEHLFTDEGKEQLQDAIELKKRWKEICEGSDFQSGTYGVKKNLVPNFLKNKLTCVEITPIGLNNMCHHTSLLFAKKHKDVKQVLGYNITACPCGKLMTFEIHSLNKIDDKLYDFTRDFNEEKTKYFVELDTQLTPHQYNYLYGGEPMALNKGCSCRASFGVDRYLKSELQIKHRINTVEKAVVEEIGGGLIYFQKM